MLTAAEIKLFSSLKHKKFSHEHGKFLIEGFHLIEECLTSSFNLEYIILRDDTGLADHPQILTKLSGSKTKIETIQKNSFSKLSDTKNSQGIAGVVTKPKKTIRAEYGDLAIALDRINDPGNLGTIIRTAYWFNAGSILLSPGSADIYNSKVIRASQGAVFHTQIHEEVNLSQKLNELASNGYNVYLFTLDAELTLKSISQSERQTNSPLPLGEQRPPQTRGLGAVPASGVVRVDKSVIVFGSESSGISKDLFAENFTKIKIEGYSKCESLNVAIAAGIAMYELRNKL